MHQRTRPAPSRYLRPFAGDLHQTVPVLCRCPPSRSLHPVTCSLQYGSYQVEHSLSCDDRDLFAGWPTVTSPLDRVADAVPIGGDEREQITDIANAVDYSKDWQERNRK